APQSCAIPEVSGPAAWSFHGAGSPRGHRRTRHRTRGRVGPDRGELGRTTTSSGRSGSGPMARNRPLKVIIDTNVIAYYLLATEPFVEEVRAFWHRPLDPAAPTLWEAEVSNVLWMAARSVLIDKRGALR